MSSPATTVTMPKNALDSKKGLLSVSQLQSTCFCGLSFWYHANAKTRAVSPIKYGLKGSIHEKEETSPLAPPKKAKTGVMQQSEAAVAVKSPAIKVLLLLVVVVMSEVSRKNKS